MNWYRKTILAAIAVCCILIGIEVAKSNAPSEPPELSIAFHDYGDVPQFYLTNGVYVATDSIEVESGPSEVTLTGWCEVPTVLLTCNTDQTKRVLVSGDLIAWRDTGVKVRGSGVVVRFPKYETNTFFRLAP